MQFSLSEVSLYGSFILYESNEEILADSKVMKVFSYIFLQKCYCFTLHVQIYRVHLLLIFVYDDKKEI